MGGDDKDRRRDRDRSRSRSRSRDRRRDRSRDRSRSRSRSPRREGGRKRKSLFDVGGPPGGAAAAVPGLFPAAAPAGFSAAPAGFSAAPTGFSAGGFSAPPSIPSIPGLPAAFPGMSGTVPGFPNMPLSMAPPPSQQATRHARRVYVGGLPPTASEQSIATFFSSALAAVGGASAGPGNAVVNVYINKEKNFAFVEFRTVEETSNAMALDGIMFEGVSVRVRRPNDYNPTAAAALGPAQPSATLNLAAIGLGAGKGTAPIDSGLMMMAGGVPSISTAMTRATENRIFVGGIPYYLTEEQCKELLGSFGAIKSFELIKDKETGQGKGYGFVVYQDPAVTDIAIAGLNGLKMGERTLTVRRAETGGVATNVLLQTHGISGAAAIGVPGVPPVPAGMPAGVPLPMAMPAAAPMMATSRIVVLQEAVTVEELANEEEYKDIVEDMKDECAKHGALNRVIIPRPTPTVPNPPGLGKVVVEYADVNSAMKARNSLNGRKFDGRTVIATFLPEDKYLRGEFDASAA